MATILALPNKLAALEARIKVPDKVPPFGNRLYALFWAIWIAAFLLAVIGPIAGVYKRATSSENNSLLLLGSRAGIAVEAHDATSIRFPVGPIARELGIRPGDDIIAIFGLPVPDVMPASQKELAKFPSNNDDLTAVYINFSQLLHNAEENFPVTMTLRSVDGLERDVTIDTGEHHIEADAREMGLPLWLLNLIDLTHVIFYPFLLWASWILHRRNARDAVSSILSLAILLTIGTEEPSATFLTSIGISRPIHVFLYDLGNICLLAGILLFPHGKLTPRLLLVIAALPILTFLEGDPYKMMVIIFMAIAVTIQVQRLRATPPGDLRQQIKWALYGFAAYAFFWGVSVSVDILKTFAGAFSTQLMVEVAAGFSLGIAFLSLQTGLLVALLRFRLYDAEAIISRTATIAIVTLVLAAVFAGIMEGIITQMQDVYAEAQTPAAMIGAIMATVLIHPLHNKVQGLIERRFHKNLIELRETLPELMRDLREVATMQEFVHEVLHRMNAGVYSDRSAIILGSICETTGVTKAEVRKWFKTFTPKETNKVLQCDPDDKLFPIRVRLVVHNQPEPGWLLVGSRPDGSLVGGDEREAVSDMADPMTRALRIIIERTEDHKKLYDILDDFGLRIAQLEQKLA